MRGSMNIPVRITSPMSIAITVSAREPQLVLEFPARPPQQVCPVDQRLVPAAPVHLLRPNRPSQLLHPAQRREEHRQLRTRQRRGRTLLSHQRRRALQPRGRHRERTAAKGAGRRRQLRPVAVRSSKANPLAGPGNLRQKRQVRPEKPSRPHHGLIGSQKGPKPIRLQRSVGKRNDESTLA